MTIKGKVAAILGATPGRRASGDLLRLADAARDRKDYPAAAKLYDQALRAAAPTVDILLVLQCGHMYKDAGNFAEAEARYLKALGLEPNNAEVLLQLGHFYKTAGHPADARRYYREALAAEPGLADAEAELHRLGTGAELPSDKRPPGAAFSGRGRGAEGAGRTRPPLAARTSPPCRRGPRPQAIPGRRRTL